MKIHLKHFRYPLTEGKNLKAECGREVLNARFVHAWDNVPMGTNDFLADMNIINLCRKCFYAAAEGDMGGYVYALVSGEELKQAEAQ
jgi:hypothetical protein